MVESQVRCLVSVRNSIAFGVEVRVGDGVEYAVRSLGIGSWLVVDGDGCRDWCSGRCIVAVAGNSWCCYCWLCVMALIWAVPG